MKKKEGLRTNGYYETPDWVADLLAKNIDFKKKSQVIDLGVGKGALSKAVLRRSPASKITALDINGKFEKDLDGVVSEFHKYDLVSNNLEDSLLKNNLSRIIVSNPPFGRVPLNNETRDMLVKSGVIPFGKAPAKTRMEAIFLAKALSTKKKVSSVAFVVSSSFIYSNYWSLLRHTLIEKHGLWKVILLPSSAFQGTEVESAIIFLKSGAKVKNVLFEDYIKIDERKDFSVSPSDFFEGNVRDVKISEKDSTLGSLVEEMYRGVSCAKYLKVKRIDHIHSSDVSCLHSKRIQLPSRAYNSEQEKVAKPGDILVARVGTRCLGKAVYIESGGSIITDSVISIRVPSDRREEVFRRIISQDGQDWLRNYSRGACAKIITYSTMQNFPLGAR